MDAMKKTEAEAQEAASIREEKRQRKEARDEGFFVPGQRIENSPEPIFVPPYIPQLYKMPPEVTQLYDQYIES